ncbi:MAG: hypothetical protein IPK81_22835 [Rhodospirillales bacterium]|nr:MAG: hypothetical protein IPK81_22835 [Rhodospirillales bacterium]
MSTTKIRWLALAIVGGISVSCTTRNLKPSASEIDLFKSVGMKASAYDAVIESVEPRPIWREKNLSIEIDLDTSHPCSVKVADEAVKFTKSLENLFGFTFIITRHDAYANNFVLFRIFSGETFASANKDQDQLIVESGADPTEVIGRGSAENARLRNMQITLRTPEAHERGVCPTEEFSNVLLFFSGPFFLSPLSDERVKITSDQRRTIRLLLWSMAYNDRGYNPKADRATQRRLFLEYIRVLEASSR